jgi:hypothetical protein
MPTLIESIGSAFQRLVVVAGWPVPRYARRYATMLEVRDRDTDEPRRRMISYLQEDHRKLVVAPQGRRTEWVRNALAAGGRLSVLHDGLWRDAHIRVSDADPNVLIDQMPPKSARNVRRSASDPCVVEILFDWHTAHLD